MTVKLFKAPPPELQRSIIARQVFGLLSTLIDRTRVWPDHTGYRIGTGWIEPDASISWPDQARDAKYFTGSPILAVEILSPDEEIDRKLTLYFGEGCRKVWVIDARRKSMTVYADSEGRVIREVAGQRYRSSALNADVSLTEIFI